MELLSDTWGKFNFKLMVNLLKSFPNFGKLFYFTHLSHTNCIFKKNIYSMSSKSRMYRAYNTARRISFNDDSKFIIFSDCHRGDNSFADEFANNRNIYFHALQNYYKNGFTYCELGDGDELWENISFKDIFEAHQNVYELMKLFYNEGRLYRLYGNHDMVYKNESYVEKNLFTYFDKITGKDAPLFPGIKFTEGLILEHETTKQEIFM